MKTKQEKLEKALRTMVPMYPVIALRAIYLHASLRYVQRDYLTNSSLRDRFGIEKENSSMVSRLIKDAVEDNAIKPVDAESDSRKFARYWQIWA